MLKYLQQMIQGNRAVNVEQYRKFVEQIHKNSIRIVNRFKEQDFPQLTERLREKIRNNASDDTVKLDALSLVKAACKLVFELDVHAVQLIGASAICDGSIAEMKTGEGKTITAVFAAYYLALMGNKVHIATVNEYLAHRDSSEMSKVYELLGLSVGCIRGTMSSAERQREYECDITYATYYELGFDYLRDNLVTSKQDRVLPGLQCLLLDEADSILIDEARTPLLISSDPGKGSDYLVLIDQKVSLLEEQHVEIDTVKRQMYLTDSGIDRCEQLFAVSNLMNAEHHDLYHKIYQALRARLLYKRDVDYVVAVNEQGEQEVIIVDPSTGRLMFGRRYTEGLHQAIEAKERVNVKGQAKTIASITLQHFIQLYGIVGGMSGTAIEVEQELKEVYGLEVVPIATHRPIARVDGEDLLFFNDESKYEWIIEDIVKRHATGQPVLVGTSDIRTSEHLSGLLNKKHIKHQLLNAKNHAEEAEIIKRAGEKYTITIATNMAGRGVDIKLSAGVAELGGLHVIGTCRHASLRIDNQLIGRSGRQGAVGSSQFYVSLEDELLVNYYPEHLLDELEDSSLPVDKPIMHKKYIAAIKQAQRIAELESFSIRSSMLAWDKAIRSQRIIFYTMRNEIVDIESTEQLVADFIAEVVDKAVQRHFPTEGSDEPPSWIKLFAELSAIFPSSKSIELKGLDEISRRQSSSMLYEQFVQRWNEWYMARSVEAEQLARQAALASFDRNWTEYIEALHVAQSNAMVGTLGSTNPFTEFEYETARMFDNLLDTIRKETLRTIWSRMQRLES